MFVSDNALPPVRCQVIIWTSDGLLLIGAMGLQIKFEWNDFNTRIWNGRLQNGDYFASAPMC